MGFFLEITLACHSHYDNHHGDGFHNRDDFHNHDNFHNGNFYNDANNAQIYQDLKLQINFRKLAPLQLIQPGILNSFS